MPFLTPTYARIKMLVMEGKEDNERDIAFFDIRKPLRFHYKIHYEEERRSDLRVNCSKLFLQSSFIILLSFGLLESYGCGKEKKKDVNSRILYF